LSGRAGLAQTLPLNVCDGPKAQLGQIVPLAPTCPFGTSQTPHIGVRHPGMAWLEVKADCREKFFGEQSENVYENKEQ
jgi:hypothetical protein